MDLMERLNVAIIEGEPLKNRDFDKSDKTDELMEVIERDITEKLKVFEFDTITVELLISHYSDFSCLAINLHTNKVNYGAINNIKELFFSRYDCEIRALSNMVCIYVHLPNQ